MTIERGKISCFQLFFLCLGFFQGSELTLAFASGVTKQSTWLAVSGGFCLSIPLFLVYLNLAKKFPNKNLVQIHDLVYGPYLGKLVSFLYIWLFLSLISLNLRFFGDFFLTFIMPETPLIVFVIAMTCACAWAVNRGLESFARTVIFYVLVFTAIFILNTLLLTGKMSPLNLSPIIAVPGKILFKGMLTIAAVPFLETIVFMMIIPYAGSPSRVKKDYGAALATAAVFLMVTCLRNAMVLGDQYPLVTSSTFETIRLINLAKVFTRMELLAALGLLLAQFIKITVFYYGTVLSLAQTLNLRSYQPLIWPVGGLAAGLAVLAFGSNIEQGYSGSHYHPIYTIPFEFIIPAITLLVAKLRGLPAKAKESSS